MMFLHKLTWPLDIGGVTTFIGGILSGHSLLMILGGLASLLAIINHADQIIKRRKK